MSNTTPDQFNFDTLEPVQIPVRYEGRLYLLCDASGGTVARYRNAMLGSAQMQRNQDQSVKISGMGGLADAEFTLLAGCLWYATEGEDGKPVKGKQTVDEKVLRTWPNRVIEPLATKAKEISLVEEDKTGRAVEGPKASPPDIGTGS